MRLDPDDDGYDAVWAAYLQQGRPYKTLIDESYWASYYDGDTLFFIRIERDDPHQLDPNDPTGLWHNAYGYLGRSED